MTGFALDMMAAGLSAGAANAINGTAQLGQTATGSTQGTAFAIGFATTEFTTVAASTGAILPSTTGRASGGDEIEIFNNGANALAVYPPVGFRIGTASANASVSVPAGKGALFFVRGDGNYFSIVSA